VRNALKRTGLAVSVAAHVVILAAFLSNHQSPPQLIPVSIATITQWERHVLDSDESIKSEAKQPSNDVSPLDYAGHLIEIPARVSLAGHPDYIRQEPGLGAQPKRSSLVSSDASPPGIKQYLLDAAPPAKDGRMRFVEQLHPEKAQITFTGRTDWQDSLVEDNKLTSSARGSGIRLTVREASSAGFLGTNFSGAETSAPFGQASIERPVNSAVSERIDWTLVDSNTFGMTVFGYQNQIGSGFRPFGEAKTEFSTAGTRTTKLGGQVRIGALGFGFAHSVANAEESKTNSSATLNEASVTLALSQLALHVEPSVAKLLPTSLWASVSDKRALNIQAGANNTISTSFGGAWNRDSGSTTVGYWSYSSGDNSRPGAAWNGQGFDADLGMHWSSLGLNFGLSHGRSEDATDSWQSAGALYSSSVTVSYKPDRLPAMWITAAWGNYDRNAIANSGTLSDLYSVSTKGAYTSLTAALDLANWLRTDQTSQAKTPTGPSSVKLLYRYTENAAVDSDTATTRKDGDSLVAAMAQSKF
jgi:hypothetical protein